MAGLKKKPEIDSLPFSEEAEQGVLGSMFIAPKEVIPEVIEKTTNEDFYVPAHQTVRQELISVWESGTGIDLILFTDHMRNKKLLDVVGGAVFLTFLWTFVPSPANSTYYIEIVKAKSVQRQIIQVGNEVVRKAYEEQDDVKGALAEAQIAMASIKYGDGKKRKTLHELVLEKIDRMEKGEPNEDVIFTKIKELDRLSPLRMGDMPVISGKRKSAKTALAMTILENICIGSQRPGLYFSLEDRAPKAVDRIFAGVSRISLDRHHVKHLSQTEMAAALKAAEKISKSNLIIRDDVYDLNLIVSESKKVAVEFPNLAIIVVDYGQLVRVPIKKGANREQEVATMSRALRLLSMETGVPVIVISQENALGNTRESTSLENDCTALWKIEEVMDEPQKRKLSIPFQRGGASGAAMELCFLGSISRLESPSRPHDLVPEKELDML